MGLFSDSYNFIHCERDRVKKYVSLNIEDVRVDLLNGDSIFQYIAQGNSKIVKSWLYGLDKSIIMELKDKAGWTIIHVSVMLNVKDITSYLINNSLMDVNLPCNSQSIGLINWRPIHVACEFGHSDILRLLIKANSNTELFTEAVKSDMIESCTVNGSVPSTTIKSFNILDTLVILEGWSPLHLAVIHDQYDCVDILLKDAKVYVDSRSTIKRKTALILACQLSQLKVISRLLDANSNPNCEDISGKTALYYAAKRGNSSMVALLLAHGSDARIITRKLSIAALHTSCVSRNIDSVAVVYQLIKSAPEVLDWTCECTIKVANNSVHCRGVNCFILCVLASCLATTDDDQRLQLAKIRTLLIEFSVNVNSLATINDITNMNGLHVIMYMFRKCHVTFPNDLVNLLLSLPIDINNTNSNKESAIFCAVKLNLIGFISKLLQRNADPNIADRNGMTPLMAAVNKRYTDIIIELVNNGADINQDPCTQIFILDNIQLKTCKTLHLALINCDLKSMDLLIKRGADVHNTVSIIDAFEEETGVGLLHLATLSKHKLMNEIYAYLLNLGLCIEDKTSKGNTPLIFAIRFENIEACRILLSRGANKDACNFALETPLITAALKKNAEFIRSFLQNQVDLNRQDIKGYTALHHCFEQSFRLGIDLFLNNLRCVCDQCTENLPCQQCLESNIIGQLQVNVCSYETRSTLLALALQYGTEYNVRLLLDLGADPNCEFIHNEITMTPIFLAVETDSCTNLNNLIEYGCDLNYISTPNQETILHAALRNRNSNIAKDLIYSGVNLNARSSLFQGQEVLPVHVAVQNGLEDIVVLLIKFGCSVNSTMTLKTVERVSALHLAALNDLTPTVKLLTEQKLSSIHINSTRSDSFNALLTLVSKKNVKGVQYILQAGADVSSRCVVSRSRNATCLHIAAQVGNVEIVRLLLEYGADPFARMMTGDRDGILPIHLATESGHLEIVELFCEWGISVSASEDCGLTCLHYAANSGRDDILRMLLTAGADVTSEATDGSRSMMLPIHMAAEKGHLEAVKLLLKYGSPINAVFSRVNRDNISSLYIAISEDKDDIVKYLIMCGADPNIKESNLGATPLHIACQRGHMKPLEYLIGLANSDLNVTLHSGISSLHLTSEKGYDELSFWLLRFKCDANLKGQITDSYSKKTSFNISPLNQACGFGHLTIVQMLIKCGADIFWSEIFEGNEGITPIHCAAIRGRHHIIATLIEAGVNIDEPDKKGRTALHWAVIEGFYDCVKVLVDLNADADTVDESGKTPIDYAETAYIRRLLIPDFDVLS